VVVAARRVAVAAARSMVVVASLAVEAAGGSAILAIAAECLEVLRQRGGSGGNNVALAVAGWRMLTIISIVTMTTMIDYPLFLHCKGGGKGGGEIDQVLIRR
jgi:hypothetical protein